PARVLVAEVVNAGALTESEFAQRRRGKFLGEWQHLQAGEDAVPSEHGHKPRQAGGRKAVGASCNRRKAQRSEVDETAPVGRLERVPVAFQAWCRVEPPLQIDGHVADWPQ